MSGLRQKLEEFTSKGSIALDGKMQYTQIFGTNYTCNLNILQLLLKVVKGGENTWALICIPNQTSVTCHWFEDTAPHQDKPLTFAGWLT